MEIMALFAKIEKKKFDINIYIYLYRAKNRDKNKKDECIFLNRQLCAVILKIILFD